MTIKPYYSHGGIEIYHGDCREIIPRLDVDIVLTDPPYNAGLQYGMHNDSMSDDEFREWLGQWWELLPERKIVFPGLVKWQEYSRLGQELPRIPFSFRENQRKSIRRKGCMM